MLSMIFLLLVCFDIRNIFLTLRFRVVFSQAVGFTHRAGRKQAYLASGSSEHSIRQCISAAFFFPWDLSRFEMYITSGRLALEDLCQCQGHIHWLDLYRVHLAGPNCKTLLIMPMTSSSSYKVTKWSRLQQSERELCKALSSSTLLILCYDLRNETNTPWILNVL